MGSFTLEGLGGQTTEVGSAEREFRAWINASKVGVIAIAECHGYAFNNWIQHSRTT